MEMFAFFWISKVFLFRLKCSFKVLIVSAVKFVDLARIYVELFGSFSSEVNEKKVEET